MINKISELKERVLGNKSKHSETELTSLLNMAREFSCLGEIIGREFEVKDSNNKIIYTIIQKPMSISQMRIVVREFFKLKSMDNRIEAEKFGVKGNKGRLNK